MKIFGTAKRFNQITGEPEEVWVFKEVRCDFTGEVLDDNEYCRYGLNYENQDPCFGAGGEEYEFGQKYGIDIWEFLDYEYAFASIGGSDEPEHYAESLMMNEAVGNFMDERTEWYRCFTFDAMCRHSRIRTAKRLIEEKIIEPQQLMSHVGFGQ